MKEELSQVLGQEVENLDLLQHGQIGGVYRASISGRNFVVKHSDQVGKLAVEARMLNDLREAEIRVPEVLFCEGPFLMMEYIEILHQNRDAQEIEAAKLLSALHSVSNESRMYGYYYDTTIGPFTQKNEQTQYNWALFLGQMRIMPMAKRCYDEGKISAQTLHRLEAFCRDLYKRIDMSLIYPSLLHGDVWSGNVLFDKKGACLIDPAIYYGDREMELAFIRLFDTFSERFFDAYQEVHPLSADFYENKVSIYQIYPLLVHVALYGSSYRSQLEAILKRLKV